MKLTVVEDTNARKPWYADGLSFTCTQCGNCCTGGPGYVWISKIEIERFAAYLKIERDAFIKKYCRVIGNKISLKEGKNLRGEYDCVFLEVINIKENGRIKSRRVCTAYEVRPLQCRTWPFWDGLLSTPKSWDHAAERCPGMNKGKQYNLKQIEALRDAEDWPKAT